jgi:type IV fimbrial biogenesis protein FimT
VVRETTQTGFTLIEMIVTVALAAILLTMGVPSFSAMLKNNRITTQTNQFVTAMNFARSEAIKRGVSISVVAANDDDDNNEWGPGWSVIDNNDNVLRVFPALDGDTTLESAADTGIFQYARSGRVSAADTLTMCDDREGETGRSISIAASGRVDTSNTVCP